MNIFRKFRASLQFREAIRMAEEAHATNGDRYYVMPNGAISGKLLVMDRFNFRKLKQKGYISRNALVADLLNDCFYYTPNKQGVGKMSMKEQQYRQTQFLEWKERCRKIQKAKEKKGK